MLLNRKVGNPHEIQSQSPGHSEGWKRAVASIGCLGKAGLCYLRVIEAEQSNRLGEGKNKECVNHSLHMELVACLYNLLNIRKLCVG